MNQNKYRILFIFAILLMGCKSEFDKDKEIKPKQIKEESTCEYELDKDVTIKAYKNGNSIAECVYQIKLTQIVSVNGSNWVVSRMRDLIGKGSGFFFYASPAIVKYIKTSEGYDIHITLECQLAERNARIEAVRNEEFSLVKTFDVLTDSDLGVSRNDTITFKKFGDICTTGNNIRIIKKLILTKKEDQLVIAQTALQVIPSSDFDDSKNYDFLESNNLPEQLYFARSLGIQPLSGGYQNSNGNMVELTSKYKESGVFKDKS